jgi:hypothetical protein
MDMEAKFSTESSIIAWSRVQLARICQRHQIFRLPHIALRRPTSPGQAEARFIDRKYLQAMDEYVP